MSKHHVDASGADVAGALPHAQALDQNWVLFSGISLILLQLGFALVEAGSVRYKNVQSIVIKALLGLILTLLIWWIFGYGFAYGYDGETQFLGGNKLGGYGWETTEYTNDYVNFVIRVGAAAASVSIIAGGAAERMTFIAWSILVTAYAGFIYPALVHWTFNNGWLKTYGFKDFAGSGVVVFSGAVAAVLVSVILKPRKHRYDSNVRFVSHSPLLIAFGSIVLYCGFLFFNAGVAVKGDESPYIQSLVAINTLIAGAAGGFAAFVLKYLQTEETSLVAISRGVVTGVVVVAGSANEIQAWVAFIYGTIGALVYVALSDYIATRSTIDDPIEIIPVYLAGGFLGVFLTGLFDKVNGLFYGQGIKLLGIQLLGLLIIFLWVSFFVLFVLFALKGFALLRIHEEVENDGIDKYSCQGEAIVFNSENAKLVEGPTKRLVSSQPPVYDPSKSRSLYR